MKSIRVLCLSLFLILTLFLANPQTVQAVTALEKGFTISNWLNSEEAIYTQTTRYTKQDFQDIQSLGCDHVRIYVNFFTSENFAPDHQISPIFYMCLDRAISWANELGMKVIITNTGPENVTDGNLDATKDDIAASWKNVASRYAGQGDVVLYELFAHPDEMVSAAAWNAAAAAIIAAIREVDATHTIVVGSVDGYSIDNLTAMEKFADDNVLYAFEFFDPVTFTRQGGSYKGVNYRTTVVPFPYSAGSMPPIADNDTSEAAMAAFDLYPTNGNVAYVQGRIDAAAQAAADKGISLWCASFGSTIGNRGNAWVIPDAQRAAWLEAARTQMEAKGIPWCLTNYQGNYGIFYDYGLDPDVWMQFSVFPYDINESTTAALGLTAPEIPSFQPIAVEDDLVLYDDEFTELSRIGQWLGEGSDYNFFVEDMDAPSGKYCMSIYYTNQWTAVEFVFPVQLDLYDLADAGYLFDFFLWFDDENEHIYPTFEDTNEDFEERPWRFSTTFNFSQFNPGEWNHVSIALADMTDSGAWDPDDQGWYNSQGIADWSAIHSLQLRSENTPSPDYEIYLDRIRLVNPETSVEKKEAQQPDVFHLSANYPNPFNASTKIEYSIPVDGTVELSIYNVRGELVKNLVSGSRSAGVHQVTWDGSNNNGNQSPSGIYFCELRTGQQKNVQQMLLLR